MLKSLFERAEIPPGRILFVHARLRNLQSVTGIPYAQLTADVIDCLWATKPTTILIPAYTIYSYMLSRVYHRRFSRSGEGRFSEDIRCSIPCWRSPDPMYSVLDLGDYLPQQSHISYSRTFGTGSLFEHLYQQDALIINFDLEGFYTTQLHAVELKHHVDYRFEKVFSGVVYDDENNWRAVDYQAYVRNMGSDLTQYPPYNRRRRKEYLLSQGALNITNQSGVDMCWISSQELCKQFDMALTGDSRFLVD